MIIINYLLARVPWNGEKLKIQLPWHTNVQYTSLYINNNFVVLQVFSAEVVAHKPGFNGRKCSITLPDAYSGSSKTDIWDRKSPIDAGNSSTNNNYFYSKCKTKYFFYGLINGLKLQKLKCHEIVSTISAHISIKKTHHNYVNTEWGKAHVPLFLDGVPT